jgi:hypothetical protein
MVFSALRLAKFANLTSRIALLTSLAAGLGGCASQFPVFEGVLSGSDPLITGSTTVVPAPFDQTLKREDWLSAEPSLESALDPTNLDASTSWKQTSGQFKGSFRPVGSAFTTNGFLCRNFTALVEKKGSEPQLFAATACRFGAGSWQVRAPHLG